jgi:hypothetical protein
VPEKFWPGRVENWRGPRFAGFEKSCGSCRREEFASWAPSIHFIKLLDFPLVCGYSSFMKRTKNSPHRIQIAVLALGLLQIAALAPAAEEGTVLFSGLNLAAWRHAGEWLVAKSVALDIGNDAKFAIAPGQGICVNGAKGLTVNLVSKDEFGDVEAHIEFCITKKSNSGVYFMGRYEVQIYDSFGVAKDKYPGIECGGVYPRWDEKAKSEFEGHSPRVNASKPAGEWQSFDVIFRAPRFDATGGKTENAKFVKVVHNDQVVHENVEVTGPTRSAAFDDEKPTGPLLLQGDHGPVAYRNVRLKTLMLK